MKKQSTNAGLSFDKVTPAVLMQVEEVLKMAANYRYSASKVYAAHNLVFGKNETPDTCASCNKKRADALRKWYNGYQSQLVDETPVSVNVDTRDEFKDLDGIYGHFYNTIAEVDPDAQNETEGINAILKKNGADLFPGETELLNARLADLQGINEAGQIDPTAFDNLQASSDTVGMNSNTQPGAKGLNEPNTITGGMDAQTITEADLTEGLLILKNKKGETFTGIFDSEDGVNGKLVDAEGNSLKPGTYTTETGDSYAVQPGGKATYKNDAI